ncbi:hypothetical protein BBJ28_00004867 [Nothophytophthora sp. Chile5]|nr:hypothetical protein BBJ28_00004867 [Nothophytophthora sp. Chile5]
MESSAPLATSAERPDATPSPAAAENIAVCIRVRSLNERELRNRDAHVLTTVPRLNVISLTDADGQPLSGKGNVFRYDHVFDAASDAHALYDCAARRIVRSTLDGINGSIFAYGQTSSGKTYTMEGDGGMPFEPEEETARHGILQLAVEDIFNYIEGCADRDFLLRVSFMEIYNEVVKDLLNPTETGANLKLREDPRKGVYVECKEEIITNYEDIVTLLQTGNQRRTVGQTAMNDRSSRSHSVFRIVIESKQKSDSRRHSEEDVNGAVLVASLNLVDLAGSESLRHTGTEGIRQREAGNINKSLLTLARVINALASSGGQNAPFRDSKLTRLLQNSLGGNTRTLMICCVTPSDRYLEETKSTLQFAARAKDIQTSATVNEVLDDQTQLRRLKREVHDLKKLVSSEALSALKAENEALLSEKNNNKAEMARLMGLMLSSSTVAKATVGKKRKHRDKRARETWGPGDFLANAMPLAPLSPTLFPRKRHSPAKENVNPQTLLLDVLEDADEGLEIDNDASTSSVISVGRKKRDTTSVKKSNKKVLDLFSLAFRNYRDDCDGDPIDAAEAIVNEKNAPFDDIERARVADLLSEMKALMIENVQSKVFLEENQVLSQEVEDLRAQLSARRNEETPAACDCRDNASKAGALVEELMGEMVAAQENLSKEKERSRDLVIEKENVQQMADEELSYLRAQLETLRLKVGEQQERFDGEKRELEAALEALRPQSMRSDDEEKAEGNNSVRAQNEEVVAETSSLSESMAAAGQVEQAAKYHADLEAQVEHFAEEKAALLEKIQSLEASVQETRAEKETLAAETEQSVASSDQAQGGVVEKLATELQDIMQELAQLQSDNEITAMEKQELQERTDRISEELAISQRQGYEMSETLMAKEHIAKVLQAQLDAKVMTISQLQNEVEALHRTIQDFMMEQEQLTNKLQALEEAGETTVEGSMVEQPASAECVDAGVDELSRTKQELEAEIHQLRTELELVAQECSAAEAVRQEERDVQQQKPTSFGGNASDVMAPQSTLEPAEIDGCRLSEAPQTLDQEQTHDASSHNEHHEQPEERTELVAKTTQLEEANVKLLDRLAALEGQLGLVNAELAEAKERLETPSPPLGEASRQSPSGLEMTLDKMRADFALLEQSKAEADASLEQLNLEKLSLQEQLVNVQSSDRSSAYQSLQQERDECVDELRALEAQLMDVSEEKMKLTVALEDQETKLREAQQLTSSNTEQTTVLQSQLNEAQTANVSLEETKAQLEQAIEQARVELGALRADHDMLVKRLQRQEAPSDSETDDPLVKVEKLRQRLDIEAGLRETLELDVKSYEDTMAVLRKEVKDSSDTIADLLEKMKIMEADLETASRSREAKAKEVANLTDVLEKSKEEEQELRFQSQQRFVTAEAKEVALGEKITGLEQRLREASTNVTNSSGLMQSCTQQEVVVANEKQAELQEMVTALEQQLGEARQELSKQDDEWNKKQAAAEKEFARMANEQQQLRDQLSGLQSGTDGIESAATPVIKEQLAELLEVKRAYTEASEQKEAAERELATMDAKWLQKELDMERQMNSIREQLQEAQEELEAYQKYADDEVHRLRASIEQSDEEVEEIKRTAKAREEELESQILEQEDWKSHVKSRQEKLQAKCDELDDERRALNEKYATLETQRGEVEEQLREEVRELLHKYEDGQAQQASLTDKLKEMKTKLEMVEGEAYQSRIELEDLSESLKASQMEAVHYHNQLVEAQLAKESVEELVEKQKARIDKLDKVKMTTETLDLFRKLKSNRQELQAKVQKLQAELAQAEQSLTLEQKEQRLLERKDEELALFKEHIEELRQALRVKKTQAADAEAEMHAALHDEREKAAQEIQDMQVLLKEKSALVETLETQVATLEGEQKDNISYLEKENLDLLVENRRLTKRLQTASSLAEGDDELGNTGTYDASAAEAAKVLNGEATSSAKRASLLPSDPAAASSSSPPPTSSGSAAGGFLLSANKRATAVSETQDKQEEEGPSGCAQQ